jgi:hypothetical protein
MRITGSPGPNPSRSAPRGFRELTALAKAFAQTSDLGQNLDACRSGLEVCDLSELSQSESADVAVVRHGRNVSNS